MQYNRFRDLVFQWRQRGLILPGHILTSQGRNSFDFGEISPGVSQAQQGKGLSPQRM